MPRKPKLPPDPLAPARAAIPDWAAGIELGTGPAAERLSAIGVKSLGELLEAASFELRLVWTEPTAAVFKEIARAGKQEWSRLGEKTDEALLVPYQLVRLVWGYWQCRDDPEYAWLGDALRAIQGREAEFERELPKRSGAPKQNAILPALFGALRTALSLSYREAIQAIAALRGMEARAVLRALERSGIRGIGRIRPPCECREPFPYCETHWLWLPPDPSHHHRHGAHCSGCVIASRAVEHARCVCPRCSERLLQYEEAGDIRWRCPSCQGHNTLTVHDPWPHAHCAACNRPHPLFGLGPSLFQVSGPLWACNDPADPSGCYRAVCRMQRDST